MHEQFRSWREHVNQVWRPVAGQIQTMARLNSLASQVAVAAIMATVGAIAILVLLSSFAVEISATNALHDEVQRQANRAAATITNFSMNGPVTPGANGDGPGSRDPSLYGGRNFVVIMLPNGSLFTGGANPLTRDSNDSAIILTALNRAMTTGQQQHGDLPDLPNAGQRWLWVHFPTRAYAAVPFWIDGNHTQTGAVVVFSGLTVGDISGIAFVRQVNFVMLIGGIIVGILVAIAGALLARRITQPLNKLTDAATLMTAGDFSTRVQLSSNSAELEQLAVAFNEMAATIEHDVTELRHQEQIQRELVANVAHELATPLTAIQGFSEALVDDVINDKQEREEIGRIINRETVRLRRLVDQLRQVARLEAGTEQMDLQPTKLPALVDDTIEVLRGESERRHVVIHNALTATVPTVLADADRLTQVMLNLLDNALRHTLEGGRIDVSAQQTKDSVVVTVADTGIGIPAEDVPRIFERFFRADPSRARATGGSGLGLAIVKGIVEAHGGQVQATSAVGKGTRISLSLHLSPWQAEATPKPEPAASARR